MKCLICLQAETVDRSISVILTRGEFRLTVSGVPARVCPHCGDGYVEEVVARKLLSLAERESALGVLESALEYEGDMLG
ncbi:MAG: YgiT-type zinc finger protein [Chloroflexi bacterium]|nr:YgiT-type zinc finger protein [Chloroflexota bacterium]